VGFRVYGLFDFKLNFKKKSAPSSPKSGGTSGNKKKTVPFSTYKQKANIIVFESAIQVQNNFYLLHILLV
jgi:hypothetical protein